MATISVLYGSQTGNAQSIAEALHHKILNTRNAGISTLNAVKGKPPASIIIIVCSTTGNGDAPENAEAWWRQVKLRSTPKDTFQGIKYGVLGLGDTNYDKFCHMGKIIDKRLEELGGCRLVPLHCADEATNMEDVVSEFSRQALQAIEATFQVACPIVELVSDECAISASLSCASISAFERSCGVTLTKGVLDFHVVAKALGVEGSVGTAPEVKQLPLARSSSKNTCALLPTTVDSEVSNSTVGGEWSAEHPFLAEVKSANWLTIDGVEDGWDDARQVIHMELDLGASGISYVPGDAIGICCPSTAAAVQVVLDRLRVAENSPALEECTEVSIDGVQYALGYFLRYK